MGVKKEEDIFKVENMVCYGHIEDSNILSLYKNKKRLHSLRKYKDELVDAIDSSNNKEKYLKDFHLLLEIVESEFLDCSECIKNAELTENGLGQMYVLTMIIDTFTGK